MYKLKNKIRVNSFKGLMTEEPIIGISIEGKVRQMMDQNEPITDAVPMIYTSKEDGVKPEYDIRTNKWDYAIDAMNEINNYKKTKYLQGGTHEIQDNTNPKNNNNDNPDAKKVDNKIETESKG